MWRSVSACGSPNKTFYGVRLVDEIVALRNTVLFEMVEMAGTLPQEVAAATIATLLPTLCAVPIAVSYLHFNFVGY